MVQSARNVTGRKFPAMVAKGLAGACGELSRDIDKTLLFGRGDLATVLKAHLEHAATALNDIPPESFSTHSDEELSSLMESRLLVTPLALDESALHAEQHEIEVDVSKDPRRNPLKQHGPIYVIGISLKVWIPYTGDDVLWYLRPNRWRDHFPRGLVHPTADGGRGELEIVAQQPDDDDVSQLRESLQGKVEAIRFYSNAQQPQIDEENRRLRALIRQAIADRRHRLH